MEQSLEEALLHQVGAPRGKAAIPPPLSAPTVIRATTTIPEVCHSVNCVHRLHLSLSLSQWYGTFSQLEFWLACLNGNADKAKDFLAAGGNVNWINPDDSSKRNALHAASSLHHFECVQLLVNAGVDVAATDANGFNALHWAASFASHDVATLTSLISAGCGLNAVTSELSGSHTPLHFAARFGALKNVECLLDHPEIDITIKNRLGLTAAGMAEKYGKAAVFGLIQQAEARHLP
jgi:Ankyrin repeats (3 copies)